MVIHHHRNWWRGLAALLALAFISAAGMAAEVTATLDRDSVVAGNGAVLTVDISGGSAGRPEIPEVADLIVNPRGQNQQYRMENGRMSASVSYGYAVGSMTPGDYVIPGIKVTVDGKEFTTEPLKLKVTPDGSPPPPAAAGLPPGAAGQGSGKPQEQTVENGDRRFGFLTVELGESNRKHVYVGEIAPVRIRAWIPQESQAQLRSTVQPEGKAFTLHNLTQEPRQTQEVKDGKRYIVVTWFGGISATKAGKYPASLAVDATVAVRDTSAQPRRRRRGGAFDDPFFDSAFDRMYAPMIQKDVKLKSEDQEIEVRPLPEEGRPDDFTGAIGKFSFGDFEIPNTWQTGEPQSIRASVAGSGNFALAEAPSLDPADGWKTYPGKDQFKPNDRTSFSGTKTFEFSAVATKSGKRAESLKFSYFDPDAAEYKTLETPPRQVEIVGEDIVEKDLAESPAAPEPPKKAADGLVGQHIFHQPAASLTPFAFRSGFGRTLGAAGAMCLAGLGLALRRKRRDDPFRQAEAATEAAVREARSAANRAAQAGDLPGFVAAGRLAIQERLAARWNISARAITAAEVGGRMPMDSPVARYFQEADLLEYNRPARGGELPRWRGMLEDALASLQTTEP